MKTLIYRLAALLMAAFALCGTAGAATLYDDLNAPQNMYLTGGNGRWIGNRMAVGSNKFKVTEVTIQVEAMMGSEPLTLRVCDANASNNGPGSSCQAFAMDQVGNGQRTFTGSFIAQPNSNLWVVMGLVPGQGSTYTVGVQATNNSYGRLSQDGGSTWMQSSNVAMRVRGDVLLPLVVTSIAPAEGPTPGGTQVVVSGSELSSVHTVRFGGQNAASFTIDSATRLVATTPPGVAGAAALELVNDFGPGTSGTPFTYVDRAGPSIASLQPAQVPAGGGAQMVIHGAGFHSVTAVRFGGTAASFSVASDTQITATTPAMGAGAATVEVVTPFGTATGTFTALNAPTLSNITPGYGAQGGGATITLTGWDLATTTGVSFGGVNAASFAVASNNQLTVVTPPASTPGTVQVVVTTLGGVSNPILYQYAATPVLTGISPARASIAGGTSITLTGQNLDTAGFSIDGAGVSTTSRTATQATFTAPAHVAGSVAVVATSMGGSSQPLTLTYVGPPSVLGVQPATGPVGGGTSVLVYGQGFLGASAVTFGGTPASQFTVVNDTLIDAVAPPHAAGPVQLWVTTVGGSSIAGYTYTYPQPTVSGFTPASGAATGGTAVTITGTGFTGALGVRFGGVLATGLTVQGDTQLAATTPAGTAGSNAIVTVITPGGQADASGRFAYMGAPTLTALQPSTGPAGGGTAVVISGSGFTGATAVSFGGTAAQSFTVNGDTQITAIAPAHAAGNAAVQVTTPGGVATGASFAYVAAPAITSVQPNRGPVAGGATVIISGSGLSATANVLFGGTVATSWGNMGDGQLNVTIPAHAAGSVTVEVVTQNGNATGGPFTFALPPTITALAPDAGPAGQATPFVITGTGFTGTTTVQFGNAVAHPFTVDSDTQITATTPASQAPGSVPVQVVTPTGIVTSATSYLFAPLPVVSAIAPTQGLASGGSTVVITGTGFTRASAVRFGTTPAASFTVDSDTQITATTPAHAAGGAAVGVTTPGGTASGGSYTFVLAAPTLTSASPASVPPAGGTSVVLTGTGLTGATAVTFGGTAAASFTVDSDTQISATTPARPAGPAVVQVTAPGGTATLATPFAYAEAPVNGACGAAAGQATLLAPSGAGLCSAGMAGAVASATGEFSWICAGTHGGADSPRCAAPWAATGSAGRAAVSLPASGGSPGWSVQTAAMQGSLPAPLPDGASASHLPLSLVLAGGMAGSSARVTVNYSAPVPAGAVYLKYGPSPDGLNCTGATACAQPHWYALPASAAEFAPDRMSVTLTLADGGLGDSDTVPGQITDPGLPVLLADAPGAGATAIPALGPWMLAWLALALPALGALGRRKLQN